MPLMSRRRSRRRHERGVVARVAAGLARVLLVVLVAVAVGYAFYAALQRVADLAGRGKNRGAWRRCGEFCQPCSGQRRPSRRIVEGKTPRTSSWQVPRVLHARYAFPEGRSSRRPQGPAHS